MREASGVYQMNSDSILHQRDPEHYPEELKTILQRLTINETPKVVGSTAYAQHKYPSDVDVFEKVITDLPRNEALRFYADHFMRVAQIIVMDGDEWSFLTLKLAKTSVFQNRETFHNNGSEYRLGVKGVNSKRRVKYHQQSAQLLCVHTCPITVRSYMPNYCAFIHAQLLCVHTCTITVRSYMHSKTTTV